MKKGELEKIDILSGLVVETSYYPICPECGWTGYKTPLEADASVRLDSHLEKSHPAMWYLLKRNRLLEQVAKVAYKMVDDGCACDCTSHHEDDCGVIELLKLRKELKKS